MKLKPGVTRADVGKAVATMRGLHQGTRYGTYVASTFLAGRRRYATTLTLDPAEYVIVDFTKKPVVRTGFTVGEEPGSAVAAQPAVTVGLDDDVEMPRRRGQVLYICFLQNSPKARPHAALGMAKVVTVR